MSVIPALIFPAVVFGPTGPNLVLIFGTAMAIMVLVSLCLRPMAKRMAAVSGLYSYTAKGLGPRTAITVGWSAIFGYALVAMAGLLVVGVYVVQLFSNLGATLGDPKIFAVVVILLSAAAACFLMVRGVRISTWSTVLMETISIGILAVLMIIYFTFTAPTVSLGSVFEWNGDFDALSIGVVVAVSAFVGFESPTTLGGEAHKPFITIPRAVTWTPIVTGVLYLIAVVAQDLALKEASQSITSSSTPLAIMLVMPVVAMIPIGIIISGTSPGQGLVDLFTLGAYGYLGAYILTSASMPIFLFRIGESSYVSWVLGAVTSLALVFVLWKAVAVSIPAGNLQGLIYGGVLLASVLYAFFLSQRFPARLASVGIYDETRQSDLFQDGATK